MFISHILICVLICYILHGISHIRVSSETNVQSMTNDVATESTTSSAAAAFPLSPSSQIEPAQLIMNPPSPPLRPPQATSLTTSPTSSTPLATSAASPLPPAASFGTSATSSLSPAKSPGTLVSSAAAISRWVPRAYLWNKDRMSAKDYQQNFCSSRCDGDLVVDIGTKGRYCSNVKCLACQCARPACEIYGTCCPDITEPQIPVIAVPLSLPPIPALAQPSPPPTLNKRSIDSSYSFFPVTADSSYAPSAGAELSDLTQQAKAQDHPKLLCDATVNHEYPFILYIKSCPPDFMFEDVKLMCELNRPPSQVSAESIVRVTDRTTNVIYYNKYCAECNGVTEAEMVAWTLNIDCVHNMGVYSATTQQEFLWLSLEQWPICKMRQEIPTPFKLFPCEMNFYTGSVRNRCNMTGVWEAYDDDVKRACEGDQLSSLTYMVYNGHPYKNVFCAICNVVSGVTLKGNYPWATQCSEPGVVQPIIRRPPFSFLLALEDPPPYERRTTYQSPFTYSADCTDLEWPSPNGDCLPLQCSPGKLPNGTTCSTALPGISGLGYNLQLWFIPDGNVSESFLTGPVDILQIVMEKVETVVHDLAAHYNLSFVSVFNISTNHMLSETPYALPDIPPGAIPSSCHFLQALIVGTIIASEDVLRDDFENNLIEGLLNSSVTFEIYSGMEVALQPTAVMKKYPSSYCESSNETILCEKKLKIETRSYEFNRTIYNMRDSFLKVTNLLSCRFVSFDKLNYISTEYDSGSPSSVSLTLKLQVANVTFTEPSDFNKLNIDSDGNLQICFELLDDKLRKIEKLNKLEFQRKNNFKSQMDKSTFAQHVLTLICMSVSMFCLAVTLLTYFRFPVLRGVAGKNNMFLCASLLLAQAFLLAANHASGPTPLCTVLGILTHFMWLCMFCWSFICCFHMFRVFTAKTRNLHSTVRSEKLQLLKGVVTSVLTPALIIVTVVVTSYLSSETAEIGYGDRACYLDSSFLVGISLVLPLAVVIVCNINFFIITVVKIHNVRKLQSHDSFKKEDRQELYVYLKLCTMTGAFWTIFIIAEVLDLDSLRFIAIVLNGLQGVFIFISYICNKRVWNLYRQSFGLEALSTTSPTSEQQTKLKTERSTVSKLVICGGSNKNSTDQKTGRSTEADQGLHNSSQSP